MCVNGFRKFPDPPGRFHPKEFEQMSNWLGCLNSKDRNDHKPKKPNDPNTLDGLVTGVSANRGTHKYSDVRGQGGLILYSYTGT